METLEKFIEKRMQQSTFSAMMIPRYLEKPNAFLGSKNFTLEQGREFEEDAKKCKAVLNFLKEYKKNNPKVNKPIYKENWNPDWKGDPDDPNRWNGW